MRLLAAIGICLLHGILAVGVAFTLPAWESYDETGHYAFARYIAVHQDLPPAGLSIGDLSESHQPPLYYFVASLPMRAVDTSDNLKPEFLWGRRVSKPDPRMEAPFAGTGLALRLGRLVSVVFSMGSVFLTYLVVRTLLPQRSGLALFSEAIHAFWPINVYLGGVMNNDNGIKFAASLALFFGARVLRDALSNDTSPRVWLFNHLALAVSVCMAMQMKESSFAVLLFAGLLEIFVLIWSLRRGLWRMAVLPAIFGLAVVGLTLLGAEVTDGRSVRLFDTASGFATNITQSMVNSVTPSESVDAMPTALSPLQWIGAQLRWDQLLRLNRLFVGQLGWGGIRLPEAWYGVFGLFGVMAIVGDILLLLRGHGRGRRLGNERDMQQQRQTLGFAGLFLVCLTLAPGVRVIFSQEIDLLNGRFLLPAWSGFAIAGGLGLHTLLAGVTHRLRDTIRPVAQRGISIATASAMALVVAAIPSQVIAPVFTGPPILVAEGATTGETANINFGNQLRLLGYAPEYARTGPGGYMTITMFWERIAPMTKNYRIRVEGFSKLKGYSLRTQREAEPALGAWRTSEWRDDEVYSERYFMTVWDHTPVPLVGTFRVDVIDPETGQPLPPTCETAMKTMAPCEARIGTVALAANNTYVQQWRSQPGRFQWSDPQAGFELVDVEMPKTLTVGQMLKFKLLWRSLRSWMGEMTVFVHLVDSQGRVVSQHDMVPGDGEYPFPVWSQGEIVPQDYFVPSSINLESGHYRVRLGVYKTADQQRIPVATRDGTPSQDDIVDIAEIDVVK